MEKYVIVTWPESQIVAEYPEFEDNSCLINDGEFLDRYGYSAYFVNEEWLKHNDNKNILSEKQSKN